MDKIWLSPPHIGKLEFEFVKEAFETNWVSPVGPHINGFEKELAEYNGIGHCAALSSGTAAIHLALILAGVTQGDEVICSTFTFSGSCNPIVYQGATPVFVDSEEVTWNMNPDLLEEAIVNRLKKTGKLPKAIIAVHLYGMPAQMERIQEIAAKYGILVIEDAAEALGATINGKKAGTFGDFGVFSFNGNKIITTSGGGALVSDNEEFIRKARFLATQARDPAPHYEHSQIGYNYRLSNICAGIGRGQLRVLDDRIGVRRRNFERYAEFFKDFKGVHLLKEPAFAYSNRWLTTILVDPDKTGGVTSEALRIALESQNIESRPLWKPMHMQPVFKGCPSVLSGVSESLFLQGLCLPSGTNLSDGDFDRIFDCIRGGMVT